ncbi:MAG: hypothetical protein WKF94_02230 [Solirubrobacteraceae bacterium]
MRYLALTLLTLLACAAPAQAQPMEVGMQDDQILLHGVYDRDLALDQFEAMGGTHVRINVEHRREKKFENEIDFGLRYPMKQYDAAVKAVTERGLKVQLTLIWNRRLDPAVVAGWMGNLAKHFGNKVNRYSVLNEPDLSIPLDGRCDGQGQRKLAKLYPSKMIESRGRLVAKGVLVKGTNVPLEVACRQFWRGHQYRGIFNASSRAIHKSNRNATVLAGETSALAGLEWFVRGAYVKPLQQIDGWAHHPFQLRDLTPQKRANGWGVGNLAQFKQMVKVPVYLTEFGYPAPNSTMDKRVFGRRLTYQEVGKALPKAWAVAKAAGVRQMLQYQWYRKPPFRKEYWDTSINMTDNGKTSPGYKALQKLILSW